MNPILLASVMGFVGGLVRSLVGLSKAMALKKKINPIYWLITILTSSIIGVFTGVIFDFDHRLSLLAGYAGTDLLEGIYKSFAVQKFYFKPK